MSEPNKAELLRQAIKRAHEHAVRNQGGVDRYLLGRFTAENKDLLAQLAHWKNESFLCPPHLLDSTQPQDYGVTSRGPQDPDQRARWIKHGSHKLYYKEMPHKLSCSRNLQSKVIGKTVLYSFRKNHLPTSTPPNPFGVLPEISFKNCRRCCVVCHTGMRCCNYSSTGIICHWHRTKKMKDFFGEQIKSQSLREHYLAHLENPDYKNNRGELAILRGILSTLLGKLSGNPSDLAYFDAITALIKQIGSTVESISTVETKNNMRLSIDQLHSLLEGVVGLVVRVMEPTDAQLDMLSSGISNLQVMKRTTMDAGTLAYGEQQATAKMSTARDAYTRKGIEKDAFTEAEVIRVSDEQREMFDSDDPLATAEKHLALRREEPTDG